MNFENSVKNLLKLLIFAFFIAMPFIYFCIQIYDLYNDGNVGKFILLINTVVLPLEVLINAALNIAGFCILKKDKNWSRLALLYLFIQGVVSVLTAVLQIRIEMILMCLLNVFLFLFQSLFTIRAKQGRRNTRKIFLTRKVTLPARLTLLTYLTRLIWLK